MKLKRSLIVVLAVALVASLTACGGNDKNKAVGKANKEISSAISSGVESNVESSEADVVEVSEPTEEVDPDMPTTTSVDGIDASANPNLKIAELVNVIRDEETINKYALVTSVEEEEFGTQATLLGLTADDVAEFAFAVNKEDKYVVAVIKPAEGKETLVKDELNVTAQGLSSDTLKYEVVEESGYMILANNTPETGEMTELTEQIKAMVAFEAENVASESSEASNEVTSDNGSSVTNDVASASAQIIDEASKLADEAISSATDSSTASEAQ